MILFASCAPKSLEKNGGLVVNIGFADDQIKEEQFNLVVEVISQRTNNISHGLNEILPDFTKQEIEVRIPLMRTENFQPVVFTKQGKFSILETYDNTELFEYILEMDRKLSVYFQEKSSNSGLMEKVNESPLLRLLSPNINQTGEAISGSLIGRFHESDFTMLQAYLAMDELKSVLPGDCRLLPSVFSTKGYRELHAIKILPENEFVDYSMIESVRAKIEEYSGMYSVYIQLKPEYHNLWAKQSRENIGRALAIVVDNEVYSAPMVQSEIAGGSMQISGSFTQQEAKNLASVLNESVLPVKTIIKSVDYFEPGEYQPENMEKK